MTNTEQNFVLAFNDAAAQLRRLVVQFGNEGDGFATFFAVNGKLFRLRLTEVECGDEPDVFMATEPAVAKAIAEMDAKDEATDSQRAEKEEVWTTGSVFYSPGVKEPTLKFVTFFFGMSKSVDVEPMIPCIYEIGHKCGRIIP